MASVGTFTQSLSFVLPEKTERGGKTMPIYHYRCLACGYETEIEQRITEPALTTCTNCGQEAFQRVISAAGGFVLKGTGFYNTDYKNNNNRAKSDSKKSTETSTEKTPAAATAS